MIIGSTTNSASDGMVNTTLAVAVVSRRSDRRALHQHAQRHRDRQPDQHRHQRQPQMDHGQRPGVVEVGEQIVHRLSPLRFCRARPLGRTAASTSAASTPPITLPASSTATPIPDGDDSAASSAWLRLPPRPEQRTDRRSGCRTATHRRGADAAPRRRSSRAARRHRRRHRPAVGKLVSRQSFSAGDPLNVVQRQTGRVQELQPSITASEADEPGHEIVGRPRQQPAGLVVLLQRTARPNTATLVAEPQRLVDVVGDEDDRLVQFALQAQYFASAARGAPPGRRRRTARPSTGSAGRRPALAPRRPAVARRRRAARDSGSRVWRPAHPFEHRVGGLAGGPARLAP